jgi:hypothetical protein
MAKLVYTPAKGLIQEPGSGIEMKGAPLKESTESVTVLTSATATLSPNGITLLTTSGGASGTITLPNGSSPGQMKLIVLESDGGNATLSVTTHNTSTPEIFTATDPGDNLLLVWGGDQWSTVALGGWAV